MLRHAILMIGLFLVFICCLSVIAEETKPEAIPLGEALMERTGDVWAAGDAFFSADCVEKTMTKADRKLLASLRKSETGLALLLVGHARAKAIAAGKTPPPFGKIKGATMCELEETEELTGAYHVLLTNYVGLMKQSFAEDRTFDDEVWTECGQTVDDGEELAAEMKQLQGEYADIKKFVKKNIN